MKILTTDDIKQLGSIMGIWAHPDDESFSCGGILAAAARNGQTIACITATKGEAGIQDVARWPAEILGEIRSAEMAAALAEIGCSHHHWLGYPDGGCKDIDEEEAINKIVILLDKYQIDTILTFGPDGMTGHDDHKAVAAWALTAAKRTKQPTAVYQLVFSQDSYHKLLPYHETANLFFNTDKPRIVEEDECDILFDVPELLLDKKYAALKAMPSQTDVIFKRFDKPALCAMLCTEAFVKA